MQYRCYVSKFVIYALSFSFVSTNIDGHDPSNVCQSTATNSKILNGTKLKTTSSSNVPASASSSNTDYENISVIEHQNNLSSIYNGQIIGQAKALVDYTPSPYDRDALRFKVCYEDFDNCLYIYIYIYI